MTSTERVHLDDRIIRRLPAPPPGEHVAYRDTIDVGYFLEIRTTADGETTRRFGIQRELRGRTIKMTVGRFPTMDAATARRRARELLNAIATGTDPRNVQARDTTTLEIALGWHTDSMRRKECSPRSIAGLEGEIRRLLRPLLPRPLAEITRDDAARSHARITEKNGPYIANRVWRSVRACYRTAHRRVEGLPEPPTIAITWNKARRRREPILDFHAWRSKLDAVANPVRRDLHLLAVYTGLRSTDIKTIRWEDVDMKAGTLHRPTPKGGEDRAFTIPLSRQSLDVLRRRQRENALLTLGPCEWAFPTAMHGHLAETRIPGLPSLHRLRDSFATAAHAAQVDWMSLRILMNHTLPGDSAGVTAGYIRPTIETLRVAAQRIADEIEARMAAPIADAS